MGPIRDHILIVLATLGAAAAGASAQTPETAPATQPAATAPQSQLSGPQRLPWSEVRTDLQEHMASLLTDANWPIRVFGILRLERYSGPEPQRMIREAVA